MAKRKSRRRKRRTKRTGKSIHLGNGFRLNISKSGINLTGGVTGARFSVGTKGLKSTLSIPGTGISKTKTFVSTKDIIDTVRNDDDKDKKIKKTSNKSDKNKSDDKSDNKSEEKESTQLNDKELEALRKREESAKRVEAVESQFKTGNHKNTNSEKAIAKDLPKSFMKEGFKSAWWIGLIVLGAILLMFNLVIGAVVIIAGGILLLLEYQLPKNRAKRYFNSGVDLYKEKKYEEALKEMEKAILFDSDHEYINITMGTIKQEVFDDTQGAIVHFTKVVDLYQNKNAIYLLGKCYFILEEYVKTIELLQMLSFKKDKEQDRVLLLSRCYLLTNQTTLAIEILQPLASEYVINKDELIDVNYWLGYAYLDDFDYENAKVYLELVYHQDPDFKDIKRLVENLDV